MVAIAISDSGRGERRLTVPVVNGAFSASLTLPDGDYTATAQFADEAGNTATITRTFQVVTPSDAIEVVAAPPPVVVAPSPQTLVKPTAAPEDHAARPGGVARSRSRAPRRGPGRSRSRAGGVKKRVKLTRGAWSATIKLRRAKKVTVDASPTSASPLQKTVK